MKTDTHLIQKKVKQRKAIALISGGLDSLLAARVMIEQGIHVEGINFFTGFCVEGHTHAIRKQDKNKQKRNNALWAAEQLGIKLHIIEVIEEYKDIVINPRHGYGANLNPCLDCNCFMVKTAFQWIVKNNFDFIITGEVIGQRPMSQRKDTMPVVARESGANDLLVRPLCAKNLPATLPEINGWIDREKMHGFSGRSRKPQFKLAAEFALQDYAQPAGGCCFLTDKSYANKLTDLWQARGERKYEFDDIMLLKIGRHLRPRPNFKIIVGREEGENNFMEGYKKQFTSMYTLSHSGPLVLIDGKTNEDDIHLAARLTARFSQGRDAQSVQVLVKQLDKDDIKLEVHPMSSGEIPQEWYV